MSEQCVKNNNVKKLIAVSIGHFVNDFYAALIAPISYLFAIKLGLNLTQQGAISIIILVFSTFFQPFFGLYADKKGKAGLLIISVAWIAIWTCISGIVNNYYALLFVLAIGSSASALYHPLGSTASVSLAEKTKGTSLSIFMTIGGFAGSVSPIVGLWVAENYGVEKIVFLIIPGIIAALYMYISKVYEINIKTSDNNEGKAKLHIEKKKIGYLILLIIIILIKTLGCRYMVTYGIQILTLKNVAIAALMLTIHLFGRPLGTIIGGILTDRIGEKKTFVSSIGLSLICLVAISFGNGMISGFSFAALGFCSSLSNTVGVMLSHKLIPNSQSFATGMIMGLPAAIGSLAMLIFSRIADVNGLVYSSKLLVIPFVLALILVITIPYEYE